MTRPRKNGPLLQPKLLVRPPSPPQIWAKTAPRATVTHPAENATADVTVTVSSVATVQNALIDQKVVQVLMPELVSPGRNVVHDQIGLNAETDQNALIADLVLNVSKVKPGQIAPTDPIVVLDRIDLSVANVHLVETGPTVPNATEMAADRAVKADREALSRVDSINPMVMDLDLVKAEAAISVAAARIVTGWLRPSATGLLIA
jgi:hypothetical protein